MESTARAAATDALERAQAAMSQVTLSTTAITRDAHASTRRARPALLAGVSQIVASQAVLAVAGIVSLPVLAHRLGPARYGDFSLYVTIIGVVAYQDFARQLIVHEQAKERASGRDLDALTRLSTLCIVALALIAGVFLLEPASACALVAATLLHGLASRDFATLSVEGRVGTATAVRNCAWAGAFVAVAALSFVTRSTLACSAPFALANLAIVLVYRRLVGARSSAGNESGARGPWLARLSGWSHLRRSPALAHYRREAANLLGFTVAASVLACADRILLKRTCGSDELGFYSGHADFALRLNIVGSALSSTLFPLLARNIHEHGYDDAARKFVRIASWTVLAYAAAVTALLCFERDIVRLVLGPAFAVGPDLFALMLVALLVQAFGFLITPWQRAQGDFATQRHAYNLAAVLMLGVGIVLVPWYGALGAVAALLCSRIAELQLLVREVRRLPRDILPRWKVVAAALILLSFTGAAGWHFAH